MSRKLVSLRRCAAAAQNHLCYYCGLPIWEDDPLVFCGRFNLSPGQANLLRSTAEHLTARCDGGLDNQANIVAACWHCNRHRHAVPNPKSSRDFRRHIQVRMQQGRWLAGFLPVSELIVQHRAWLEIGRNIKAA